MDTLDDTMLAARWARAVLAGDASLVAACEIEAERRGVTCRGLVAATTKKKGETPARTQRYDSQGRVGKTPPSSSGKKGFNPNRKKKGEKGGGQFTTSDDPAGSGGGGGGGSKDAEKAAREAEKTRENLWKIAEDERTAKKKAEEGDYRPLQRFAEKMEAARRKARDLAQTDEEREQAEKDLADAQAYLDDVNDKAAKAKTAKESEKETKKATEKATREAESERKRVERKAETEAETARRKTERETAAEAARVAESAEIAKNYPVWEQTIRAQYKDLGLSEAELNELILQDRARRVRALPRSRR